MKNKILLMFLFVTISYASDFSSMTWEQLLDERQNITSENKKEYQAEVKKRLEQIKEEEKTKTKTETNSKIR